MAVKLVRRKLLGSAGAASLLGAVGAFGASGSASAEDTVRRPTAPAPSGLLPKSPPTSQVIVLDVSGDLSGQDWEAKEALMAATAIQGLVNRTSSTKIYFTHTPQEHFWRPYAADQAQLDDGLIPVDHIYPRLDTSKKYPVLSYLLAHYSRPVLTGKVLCPPLSETVVDGAVMAAITASGVNDSIPLSPAIENYVEAEGYRLPVKDNTRSLGSNASAYLYAKTRYLTRTTRSFVGQHSWTAFGGTAVDQVPIFYDYFISHRAFVFCLNGNDPEQRALISDLLNSDNYPVGTMVLGLPVDEGAGINEIRKAGYYIDIVNVPNTTVTSSFPLDTGTVVSPPAPSAARLDPDGAYITLYVTDGDSCGFPTNFHYEKRRNSTFAGQVPIGWSTNPLIYDLFPTLLAYYSSHTYNEAYELVTDYGHGEAPDTEAGRAVYIANLRSYHTRSKGVFRSFNYFYYEGQSGGDEIVSGVAPYYGLRGYQGGPEGNDMNFYTLNDGDVVTSALSGYTQGYGNPDSVETALRGSLSKYAAGTPAFVAQCAGDGKTRDVPADMAEVKRRLEADPQGRKYYFLTPRDFAATWRAHQGI